MTPPPLIKEFNWIWQKWLHDLWKENEPGGGSAGDVTKVGTPVNNQVGIWTGDGTIEGSENLTFSTATLTVGSASDQGQIYIDGNATDSPVLEFHQDGTQKARIQFVDGDDIFNIYNLVGGGEIRLSINGSAMFILEEVGLTLGAGGIRLGEQADHGFTPSAAKGQLWVKSTATQQLIFTDDAGTDYNLLDSIGGSIADNQVAVGNGTDAIDGSSSLTWDGTTLGVTGSIEADGNLTLNNSNTSIYLDDTSGSTAGTDRLQFNIDNDIFSIKSRNASTNALNEGVWVGTNAAGSLTTQEFYIANSVELTLTAGNATFAGDVKADGYIQSNTATDTELNDIAHAINTNAGKIQGAMVYNTTQDKPVWAVGNTDGSLWVDGAGTTANTPV